MSALIKRKIELLDQYMLVFLFIYAVLGLACMFSGIMHAVGGGIFWIIGILDALVVWPIYYWHIKVKLPRTLQEEREAKKVRVRKDGECLVGQYLRESLENATDPND